jgi:V/A-type H+/Na+-transporting ATPase subunit A
MQETKTRTGKVFAIVQNLISVKVDAPVINKELCYVVEARTKEKLLGEVIKVQNELVNIQVFESTRGIRIGDPVEFTGNMLEVDLAPGLLSRSLDGLQNDLHKLPGTFLKRGTYNSPIELEARFHFVPTAKIGDMVSAGDWLGHVRENWFDHQIMVPFKLQGQWVIKSLQHAGDYAVKETIAVLANPQTREETSVTMLQKWPVYRALTCFKEKHRPNKLLETGIRVIDAINPMAEGGTGFIPGPFGCGKTVLQHLISQYASADLIVIAACGERANEVVELFVEFPELEDPRTGRKLMERTIIVCNTSNMPVAAREASVYTAMAISEYYRQMGLRVLLLADSTSRWAQALREIANKMEELPGPDAFPMDLTATISSFYARAGYVTLNNGKPGSITFIGTVSPAGGNLKEPVTEATKKSARCFYALAQSRADAKRYPAIDPVDSYSKYLEFTEVQDFLQKNVDPNWVADVLEIKNLILRGKEAFEQINILGDDSVPLTYHDTFWKAEMIDFSFLQQDAFDKIDCYTPMNRQKYMLKLILSIARTTFNFKVFGEVQDYFKKIINLLKQMNYCPFESEQFKKYEGQLQAMVAEKKKAEALL